MISKKKNSKKNICFLTLFLLLSSLILPLISGKNIKAASISTNHSLGSYINKIDLNNLYQPPTHIDLTPEVEKQIKRAYGDNANYAPGPNGVNAPMTLDGLEGICANPTVLAANNYSNRLKISVKELNENNLDSFLEEYIAYKYPAMFSKIHSTFDLKTLKDSAWITYISGVILQNKNSSTVIEEIYQDWGKDLEKVVQNNMYTCQNVVHWSWLYSLDAYLARSYGGSAYSKYNPDTFNKIKEFYTYLKKQIESGDLVINHAEINIYYNPSTANKTGLYSNAQVVNTYNGNFQKEEKGNLSLKKVSSQAEMTKDNDAYRLAGAEYGLYETKANARENRKSLGKLITLSDGSANTIEKLPVGNYYIKEIKASKGFAIDPEIYLITVKPGETTLLTVQEIPQNNPLNIALHKKDAMTGLALPQGEASLADAEFTFKFYAGEYAEGLDPANQGIKPSRRWVFKTDKKGSILFQDSYKVSGDEFYLNSLKMPTLPLGTLTIEETKAPEGYKLDKEIFVRRITSEGSAESVDTYNKPIIPESLITNKFSIEKTKGNGAILEAEAGAVFVAIAKKYVAEYGSFESALGHTADYSINEWSRITTDAEGKGVSGNLAYGDYIIKQIESSEAELQLLKEEISFTVEHDNDPMVTYKVNNLYNEYFLKIVKKDANTGENIILTSAHFKIKDKVTDEYVTMKAGSQVYDTFQTTAETIGEIPAGTFFVQTEEKGTSVTPLALKAGTYLLEEVVSPEGYTILDKPIEFRLEKQTVSGIDGSNDEYIEIEIKNQAQYGQLILHKQGEQFKEWQEERVTLPVQAQGKTEIVESEIARAKEALTLTRAWTEIVEYEEMVAVTSVNADTEIQADPIYKIVKKTKEEDRFASETIYTDDKGSFTRDLTKKGTYTVTDSQGKKVVATLVEEGSRKSLTFTLEPIIKQEEVKKEGLISDQDFTYYKAIYENAYLAGAEYCLLASADIFSFDGQTLFYKKGDKLLFAQEDIMVKGENLYKKGQVITRPLLSPEQMADKKLVDDKLLTEGEQLIISKIPLGNYDLIEVKAPKGYIKDETIRPFEFTPQEQTILVDLKETPMIKNERQHINAYLTKQIVGADNFENIVIGMYNREKIFSLPADSPLAIVAPDKKGAMLIEDLPAGNYYFKELSTKDGYVLNPDEFELSLTSDENASQDKIEKLEETILNEPARKDITILKKDKKTGNPLVGVTFRLYSLGAKGEKTLLTDERGEELLFITDSNGQIIIVDLAFGNYFLEEVAALKGYLLDDGRNLAVGQDSSEQTVVFNERTSIAISKIDQHTGKAVLGAKLRLTDRYGNLIYLDQNNHVRDKENGKPAEWITDGRDFLIYGLDIDGLYFVEEVESPVGYYKGEKLDISVGGFSGIQLSKVTNAPWLPEIKTQAFVGDGFKEAFPLEKVWLSDLLTYTDLIPNKEYKAKAELVLASDPSVVIAKGELDFIPREKNGQVVVSFGQVDLSEVAGQTLVVYENLIDLETRVVLAKHQNPKDQDQQVEVKNPQIKTSASFLDENKEMDPTSSVTVIDIVSYNDLIVGETYTVKGKLVDKDNPSVVIAQAETSFVAEKADGEVEVIFNFDASDLSGKELVVFEYLYYGEDLLAKHEDPSDINQTVKINQRKEITPKTPTYNKPLTADITKNPNIYLKIACLALITILLKSIRPKRKKQ